MSKLSPAQIRYGDSRTVMPWLYSPKFGHFKKWRYGQAMKSLPKGKAAWVDIACAKFQIDHPELF